MNTARTTHVTKAFVTIAIAAALLLTLTACGGDETAEETPAPATNTAMQSLDTARSTLSTTAPDAKLLIVQTAEAVSATSTPVWAYLFGSPETDLAYLVYVVDGEAMPASEYGEAGLSEEQWAEVPDSDTWKIDSNEAYEKALAASGSSDTPAGWFMGFQTYVPTSEEDSATTQPFVWYVNFFTADGAVSGDTIQVDANSGEATIFEPPAE